MGCGTQVHEKTDKHGTSSFHSVDDWYLYTSLEHYQTHACHIKWMRSEWLTDTTQFNHKRITNPMITHADKIMQAMADCTAVLKGITSSNGKHKLRDLERLVETKSPTATPTRVQPVLRMDEEIIENNCITRSMTTNKKIQQSPPRVPNAAPQQKELQIQATATRSSIRRKKTPL